MPIFQLGPNESEFGCRNHSKATCPFSKTVFMDFHSLRPSIPPSLFAFLIALSRNDNDTQRRTAKRRQVVPQRHSDGLATLPRLAALFHNDCLLLAHAALTLAHGYRQALPAPLNKTATCVDLAPPLRLLGEQVLQRQVGASLTPLRALFAAASRFDCVMI